MRNFERIIKKLSRIESRLVDVRMELQAMRECAFGNFETDILIEKLHKAARIMRSQSRHDLRRLRKSRKSGG